MNHKQKKALKRKKLIKKKFNFVRNNASPEDTSKMHHLKKQGSGLGNVDPKQDDGSMIVEPESPSE